MNNSMLAELAGHRGFICYRLAKLPSGKTDKIPFDPATGYNSDAQNPATWLLPDQATEGAAKWAATYVDGVGVGIVIYEGSGLWCIDIDGCLDEAGNLSPIAAEIVSRFPGALVEISASGTGLHIFGGHDGKLPPHKTKNTGHHIELYTKARFIALTGNYLIPGKVLANYSAPLSALAAEYFPKETDLGNLEWKSGPSPGWNFYTDDAELIGYALAHKNFAQQLGSKCPFAALWNADADTLGKFYPPNPNSKSGNPYDGSSVDQALANHLAWLTGNDCDRVLSLMQQSALKRDKWQREDYIRSTVAGACANPRKWPKLPKAAAPAAIAATVPSPPTVSVPAPPSEQASQQIAATVGESVALHAPGVPRPPDEMPPPPDAPARGEIFFTHDQVKHFAGYVYLEDIYQVFAPDGAFLDPRQFDLREPFDGRKFQMTGDGSSPTDSAWKAFTAGLTTQAKVRGVVFDPSLPPRAITTKDGYQFINTYKPLNIESHPGDISVFLEHVNKLLPASTHGHDAEILLSYLKFMVQHKGRKAAWFPFIQGTQGNGKTFFLKLMEYCVGSKYTHKPRPGQLTGQFNGEFYGKLLVAIDDVELADSKEVWGRLKPMITDETLEIERKGIDAVVREVCFNIIATSNYKNGVPIEPDGRRVAPFFCAQQRRAHLERDGMDAEYFTRLFNVDKAAVLYWLERDPINPKYNPLLSANTAPETSSKREGISESRTALEQDLDHAIELGQEGFAGGWVSGTAVDNLFAQSPNRGANITRGRRHEMICRLGYEPHPHLIGGRVNAPLPDGTRPRLYLSYGHPSLALTEPAAIRAAFLAAQPKPG